MHNVLVSKSHIRMNNSKHTNIGAREAYSLHNELSWKEVGKAESCME